MTSGLHRQANLPVRETGFGQRPSGQAPGSVRHRALLPRVFFGERDDVKRFEDVFNRDSLNKYGPMKAIEEKYDLLPPMMKAVVDVILESNRVTDRDVARYYDQRRMDLFEECSDVYFEYQMFRATLDGIIGGGQIRSWLPDLKAMKEQGEPFTEMHDYVRAHLSEDQFKRFHEMLGIKDRRLSDDLLVISCLKPAQFALRGMEDTLIDDTRRKLQGETEELVEALAHKPWLQKLVGAWLNLVPTLQPIFGKYLMGLPIRAVRWATQLPTLRKEDLIRFIVIKQSGRQELDYSSTLQYDERKMVLKPFEALAEASIIRQLEMLGERRHRPAADWHYRLRRASSAV